MVISMHTHSGQFCKHGYGLLEDSVQEAIRLGFQIYGLSEHMPRSRVQDLYPDEEGITPQDTVDTFSQFLEEAMRLKIKYAHQIQLIIGFETEWIHSETAKEIEHLLNSHSEIEYVVGSVHHVGEFPIDYDEQGFTKAETFYATQDQNGTEELFLAYFDAQYDMLSTIKPRVVGHFDLIRMYRSTFPISPKVWSKIKRNVDLISEYGGLVELNSRAFKKGLCNPYPLSDIVQYMQSKQIKFTLSDDSHGPKDVGMYYDRLARYLQDMNIDTIWYPRKEAPEAIDRVLTHPFWSKYSIN